MWVIEELHEMTDDTQVWYEMRYSPIPHRRGAINRRRWEYRTSEALHLLWKLMWSSPVGIYRLKNVETGELIGTSATGFKTWRKDEPSACGLM